MGTAQLIALDLLAAVVTAAAWLGAAGALAALPGAAVPGAAPSGAVLSDAAVSGAAVSGAAASGGAASGGAAPGAAAPGVGVGRRRQVAAGLLVAAAVLTLVRVGTALVLAGRGWWFAQDKLVLGVPLLVVTAAYAAWRRRVVPAFVAGFAAAAGPLVTLLVGYPVGWSEALIVLALVGAAGLITARAVGTRIPAAAIAVTVLFGLIGGGLAVRPAPGVAHDGQRLTAAALRGPDTPEPGGTVRRYELTAQTATVTLPSGRREEAWTFNGTVPGPPITATQGDLLEVHLHNRDIASGVTLHWHGYDVPAGEDGVPGLTQDAVRPGGEFVYRFRAEQVGTYWYHTHEVSDLGVKKGLYGSFVVTPRTPPAAGLDLALPVHRLGAATLVGDGDVPPERTVPPGTPVRLRLTDTDNTPRRFALAGVAYRLAAIDGTDLNGPGELSTVTLRLPAGGRYDLTFTMPAGPVTLLLDGDAAGLKLNPDGGAPPDATGWPELDPTTYGTPAATPFGPDSRFDRRLTMVLDRGLSFSGGFKYAFTINGRAYPDVPVQEVAEGDLVRLTVVNRAGDTHPWHLHGHRVLVLSRDGHRPTGSPLWLDTFDVRPGEVWQVAFRADNPGLWMNHCHNLSHADKGMMVHLAYRGYGH